MLAEEIARQPGLAGSTLMMLSSADRRENIARCRDIGIKAYLKKPIKRLELQAAILSALGGSPAHESHVTNASCRSIAAGACRLRVLLTEDNAVNQKLALRLLEKRGHSVVVAGNGREALETLSRDSFDIVLMDVQMPEMDGFEATQIIREGERTTGAHVPIIAMTAHAMKGDRERCLVEGMDGYISKPLRPSELFEAIESLVGVGRARIEEPAKPPFDEAIALETVESDRQLLCEMIDAYFEECPQLTEALAAAIERGDAATVQRTAHTLKGMLATLGAAEASSLAKHIEARARGGDCSLDAARANLLASLSRLTPGLAEFRNRARED
jgi:CheY-like chemotaxis protein